MKYEFFEHTADAKFRAYGETLEEAFSNAAEAMTYLLCIEQIKVKKRISVQVTGTDHKSLLYNFLEELLFLFDTQSFLLSKVENLHIGAGELSATFIGDTRIDKYEISGDVKAVTYNEMEVNNTEEGWYVQVVADI